jgi:DNA-binding SARP family transcriptional activator
MDKSTVERKFGRVWKGSGEESDRQISSKISVIRDWVDALRDEVFQLQEISYQPHNPMNEDEDSNGYVEAPLYARYFGVFALYRDQQRLPLGRSKAVLELCQYLIARPGAMASRDELIEVLWPEADPGRALHRLQVAVSSLRQVIDPPGTAQSLIHLQGDSYSFAAEAVVTDCSLFMSHYWRGQKSRSRGDVAAAANAFRAALDLYKEDYLINALYAEWTQPLRTHFMERRLNALTFLCEYSMQREDLVLVLEYAQQILEIDPLRERAHRHLMRVYYRMDQRACAIRQYHLCAELLRRELQVEPSEATRLVFRAVSEESELPRERVLVL